MKALFDFICTAVRMFVGTVLLCVGILAAFCGDFPPDASPAYIQGRIAGALLFSLIFGLVGFKMLTRRNLPRAAA